MEGDLIEDVRPRDFAYSHAMFEAVETVETVDKAVYEKRAAKLRAALLEAQYKVLEAKPFPVVIVIAGVDGAGKGETVNLLTEWMDPRHVRAHALGATTDEEQQRPTMYRFWRRLPPKGQIGVFFGSWYSQPIVAHATGDASKKDLESAMGEVRHFETMLVRESALIVKLWFHLSKKAQKKRLEELESSKWTKWRVTKDDWRRYENYDEFAQASERAITASHTEDAPWILVNGADARHRSLFVGEQLLRAINERLAGTEKSAEKREGAKPKSETAKATAKKKGAAKKKAVPASKAKAPIVRTLDLTKKLEKDDYEKQLVKYQRTLGLLTRDPKFAVLSPVLVFEGADAAGKGGAIRRLTQALDARMYDLIPIAAPTDEERAQPYLWRFWRHAPRDGKFAIFDRSWYGRVLVERVESFCPEPAWQRAYAEIVDFEEQLVRAGCPIAKFWLQISKEEQLKRFKEREDVAWKRFKITPDDWRNREKWEAYEVAASEMVERTSTKKAAWTLVEADDKHYARIKILKTVCETIEAAL